MTAPTAMNGSDPPDDALVAPGERADHPEPVLVEGRESSSSIADVSDDSSAATAAPAMASFNGVAPAVTDEPSPYTTTLAMAAPTKANHT